MTDPRPRIIACTAELAKAARGLPPVQASPEATKAALARWDRIMTALDEAMAAYLRAPRKGSRP